MNDDPSMTESNNPDVGVADRPDETEKDSFQTEVSRSKPWSFFRYRLWMLFVLFIPAAFYANYYGSSTRIVYSESKATFWTSDLTHIKFDKLPDGTPTIRQSNIDDAYQAIGVSFAFGTPVQDESSGIQGPLTIPIFADAVSQPAIVTTQPAKKGIPSGSPLNPRYLGQKNNSVPTFSKTTNPGFIGISGYPMKFPTANYPCSIGCFELVGTYHQRFKGEMTIRFHQPGRPDQPAGVRRVGFFAARLSHPEALEARLYSPSGEYLCRQSTIGKDGVYMCFDSNKKIGRIELQTIGQDEDYAISGLMFDEVK